MGSDNIKALEQVGMSLDDISPDQLEVLESLSPAELSVLIKFQQKLDSIREVVGLSVDEAVGGVVF